MSMTTIKIDEYAFSVDNISLPWVLAEPFPEPIKTNLPSKFKRFLGKIFG